MKKTIILAIVVALTLVSCQENASSGAVSATKYYHDSKWGQFEISETLATWPVYQEKKDHARLKSCENEKQIVNKMTFMGWEPPSYEGKPMPDTLKTE